MLTAPDVGVSDEVAHYYFQQMVCGVVCSYYWHRESSLTRPPLHSNTYTRKASATEI